MRDPTSQEKGEKSGGEREKEAGRKGKKGKERGEGGKKKREREGGKRKKKGGERGEEKVEGQPPKRNFWLRPWYKTFILNNNFDFFQKFRQIAILS